MRLEHSDEGNLTRYIEALGSEKLTMQLSLVPYENNGVYRCISYTDNNKSAISQNKSIFYEYTGMFHLQLSIKCLYIIIKSAYSLHLHVMALFC